MSPIQEQQAEKESKRSWWRPSSVVLKTKNTTIDSPLSLSSTKPFRFVPLGRKWHHQVKHLVEDEITLEDLERMTTLFYDKASKDATLDPFIRTHNDPHGIRFAKFIHDKLTGSGIWVMDLQTRCQEPVTLGEGSQIVVNGLMSAHVAAMYCMKRPTNVMGKSFQMDDCRVWMRLHFWALRESGIMEQSPSFADYYVRFIAHFMYFYEHTAHLFARESLRWSANPQNITEYIRNGYCMKDVVGVDLSVAQKELPINEADNDGWPYNTKPLET